MGYPAEEPAAALMEGAHVADEHDIEVALLIAHVVEARVAREGKPAHPDPVRPEGRNEVSLGDEDVIEGPCLSEVPPIGRSGVNVADRQLGRQSRHDRAAAQARRHGIGRDFGCGSEARFHP